MKPTVPKKIVKKVYSKQELISGIGLVIVAFLCIVATFYLVARKQREQMEENTELREQALALNIETTSTREQVLELRQKVGTAISLKILVNEAESTYGPEEKARKEGALWIDRASGICYVTLGALQGLSPGTKLTVFDGEKEVGSVRVETPMDVISYVRPINQTLEDFVQDYYRVILK